MYPRVDLLSARKKSIIGIGHPWIFSGAVLKMELPREQLSGGLVSVFCDGEFVCHGYYNVKSQIAIRRLSNDLREKIDRAFFMRKIKEAMLLREQFVLSPDVTACRIVFSESDGLPGFIIDKYNDAYVLQISTLGAENLKKEFVVALAEVVKPKMVYEKSSGSARSLEGLPQEHEELLFGERAAPEALIKEHGILYTVKFSGGQKTGFFCDQRENRHRLRDFAHGKRVLDVFSYSGGFSLSAAAGGASCIYTVDASEDAIALAQKNFELNNFQKIPHETTVADAFDFLKNQTPESYDVIVLDPPAFVKSAKHLAAGLKKYLTLNSLALRVLKKGGALFTCSCSAAVTPDDFSKMLTWASRDARCPLHIIEKRGHAADHPLLPQFPEAEYLKCFVCVKS